MWTQFAILKVNVYLKLILLGYICFLENIRENVGKKKIERKSKKTMKTNKNKVKSYLLFQAFFYLF